MMATATQMKLNAREGSILKRICEKDTTAIKDCIDTYGNLVWSIARRFTRTVAEAESVTEEIFRDIWRISHDDLECGRSEEKVIATIALRRLVERRVPAREKPMHNFSRKEQGGVIGRIPTAA